ncbi:hypothetical protein GCM10027347_57660 [Larkinella harenae]
MEALRQREQRNAFLLLMSDTLRSLVDPDIILNEAASVLGHFLGANRVGYAEAQADTELVAVTRNFTQGVPAIEGIYRYQDYGPALLRSMQQGQTVIRPDIANDSTLTEAEKRAHAQLQLGASLNVPLVKQGHLVAILFVHYQQAHPFTADEVALAQDTAERTWAYVEQARSEAALRESQGQLSAIINQTTAGIVRTDPDGTFTFVNKQYCQLLGYEPGDLLGHRMHEFTHPDDLARNLKLFHRLVEQGEPFEIEKRYVRKDGSLVWVHNSVSAVRNPAGDVTQLLAVSVDITDRKQAEMALAASEARYRTLASELEERVNVRTRELLQANHDLKRSNDNLQQFAYVASHDLQEPLRKIHSFSALVRQHLGDQLDPITSDYLDRIQKSSARMSTLIQDLLSYSRISIQQQRFELLSLDALVGSVLETLSLEIEQRKARIQVDSIPAVTGDARQLSQLFQNLLSNAIKFTPAGQVPQVQVTYCQRPGDELPVHLRMTASVYHQINVSDQGIGFDPKYLDRIFQVFQRLHGKNEFPGTGVGLAICQRVVEDHGGGITAHSRPGEGATFSVYLPA